MRLPDHPKQAQGAYAPGDLYRPFSAGSGKGGFWGREVKFRVFVFGGGAACFESSAQHVGLAASESQMSAGRLGPTIQTDCLGFRVEELRGFRVPNSRIPKVGT